MIIFPSIYDASGFASETKMSFVIPEIYKLGDLPSLSFPNKLISLKICSAGEFFFPRTSVSSAFNQ